MLRQIEWGVQNGPTQERGFATNCLFFENLISVKEPVINISFNVRATKMSIFTLFVNA